MKKIVLTLLLFMSYVGYSQTNGITYQAVILNPSGEQLPGVNNTNAPLANQNISLKFSIIDHNSQYEYVETVQTTTDEFGMVNLIIGTGVQTGGYASSFSTIVWNANPKRLKVDLSTTELHPFYTEISNQPFTAVPFALYAVNSESAAAIAALQATVAANAAATTNALALKEDAINKSTTTTLGTSNVLFPTQNAVKTYVDSNITTVNATVVANATAATNAIAAVQADVNQNEADSDAADVVLQNNITTLQNTVTSNAAANTTALALKEDAANKSTTTTLGTSNVLFPTQNAVKTYVDSQVASATIPDANATTKGKIQLAGDLGGTAATPTVPGLANKENSTNKSTVTTLGNSDVLFPTQNAVKTYVDNQVLSATIADADATTKGKIQLAGDLTGTAAAPVIANNAITTSKILDANVTDAKIVTVSGSKVTGNITGSAASVTGVVPVSNGGTGQTTIPAVKSILGLSGTKVAIGADAGLTSQGNDAIAIGYNAGVTNQGASSIAIGYLAGGTATQGNSSIAIGPISGGGGNQSVAIGLAAWTGANNATAVGTLAAAGHVNSSAIGYQAVTTSPNTIQLGADGVTVQGSTAITNVRTSGTLTAGAVTYPNTHGSSGQVLSTTGNGTLTWVAPTASSLSGTVAVVNGGTGATTATGALTNLGAAPIASPTFTGTVTAPIYASTPQALTDTETIAWNPLNGLNASVTLGGNRTLSFSSMPAIGSYGTLVVTQDATGGRTITLPSIANKVLGSTSTTNVTLSSAAGAKDILNFYYDGTNCYWNVGQGYGTAATIASTNLASSVSGTLAVANGGTGSTTKTTAFDALSPMTTSGDIIYGGANGTGTRLSKGSNGSILTMENDLPTWNTSIKATAGSTYNAPVGFSFIGGDWARNTGMFSDNPDSGASATLKFRIATSNSIANSYLEINPSKVSVLPTTASTSKTTGALTVAGGLGVDGNIYTNNLNASGTLTAGAVTYPNTHGTANQVLSTTGSGTLAWVTPVSSAASLTGTLAVANGGTGLSTTPANGQIDIGNGTGFTRATLTAGTAITITNTAGAITISAAVRPTTDQASATAAQTSFTLAQTPLNAKVWMFINGVRTNNLAYSVSGTTVTYVPASNNSYVLVAGDRIQFDYAY